MIDKNKGFSLVELLVAMLILMVGLLGLLKTITVAMEKNVENMFRSEALAVANDRMMLKTSKSFMSLSTGTKLSPVGRSVRGIFKNYSVQEDVRQITGLSGGSALSGVPSSKQIDISVRWRIKGNVYTHAISSVLSTTNSQ
jgi:type IV pilus assembly protein PilV